jgi:cyclase
MVLHVRGEDVGDHLRVLFGGGGNSVIFTHGRQALVADVKFADFTLKLRREVEVELGRSVERIMLTHAHFDHAAGLWAFPGAKVVLVSPKARSRLEWMGIRARYVEVEQELQLELGGEVVRVLNLGSGHTDGDLVAYFPARKLLVSGDLFIGLFEPHIDELFGGDILALSATLDRMLQLEVERIVPGHADLTDRTALARVSAYLHELEAQVRAAKAAGLSEDATAEKVRMPEWDDIKPFIGISSRAKNVRRMWKAVQVESAP